MRTTITTTHDHYAVLVALVVTFLSSRNGIREKCETVSTIAEFIARPRPLRTGEMRKTQFPRHFTPLLFSPRTYVYTCHTFPPICHVRNRDWKRVRRNKNIFFTRIKFSHFHSHSHSFSLALYHCHHHHHDMLMCYLLVRWGMGDFVEMREGCSLVFPFTSAQDFPSVFITTTNSAARGSRKVIEDIQDVPRETDDREKNWRIELLLARDKFRDSKLLRKSN